MTGQARQGTRHPTPGLPPRGLATGQTDPGMLKWTRARSSALRSQYGTLHGYDPLLSLIKNKDLKQLAELWAEAYPNCEFPRTRRGELQRDWALNGLLEYAKTSPRAWHQVRRWAA